MGIIQPELLFGWTALMSTVATGATLITGILFFSIGGLWGQVNDAVSVLQMILMVPVAIALFPVRPMNTTGWARRCLPSACSRRAYRAFLR